MLDIYNLTHAQTDYLLSYPDESTLTSEQEAQFLKEKSESENEIEILAVIDGIVVGSAGLGCVGKHEKVKHRAEFGISVDKAYWGLGIGRALLEACIEYVRNAGFAQLELEVVAENEKALALYGSVGFEEYGRNLWIQSFVLYDDLVCHYPDLTGIGCPLLVCEGERNNIDPSRCRDHGVFYTRQLFNRIYLYRFSGNSISACLYCCSCHSLQKSEADRHLDIGSIAAVEINENTEAATIGYCIGRKWWRQGIMTEALCAVISFFFEEVGIRCVNACHDSRNPNSGKVMQKCGMKLEGTRRQAGFNNQGICDEGWYSILQHEYFEKKDSLHCWF